MRKKRCNYCGKVSKNSKKFCSEECIAKYEKFEKYVNKNSKFFIASIVGFLVLGFLGMIVSAYYIQIGITVMTICSIGIFITMIVFPFATPETIKLMGVKKSIITVRLVVIIFLASMIFTTIN